MLPKQEIKFSRIFHIIELVDNIDHRGGDQPLKEDDPSPGSRHQNEVDKANNEQKHQPKNPIFLEFLKPFLLITITRALQPDPKEIPVRQEND